MGSGKIFKMSGQVATCPCNFAASILFYRFGPRCGYLFSKIDVQRGKTKITIKTFINTNTAPLRKII